MKRVTFFSALILSLSLHAAIPQLAEKDFKSLVKVAANSALPMTERWQALIKAGEIAKPNEIKQIQNFSKSSDWYMRNASLVSLESVNTGYAIDQAKVLVSDKALVVRSAAVAILTKKNSLEVRRILALELAKAYNFSGKQSLWIRPQIMQQMARTATNQDRQFMAQYLFDSDKKVAQLSVQALEKISSIQFTGPKQLELWQQHVKKNNWL